MIWLNRQSRPVKECLAKELHSTKKSSGPLQLQLNREKQKAFMCPVSCLHGMTVDFVVTLTKFGGLEIIPYIIKEHWGITNGPRIGRIDYAYRAVIYSLRLPHI
jgi:hypothetical protein